jgi:hypothetical protein
MEYFYEDGGQTGMIDEETRAVLRSIQSDEEARAKAEKLPSYVKCMYCGGRPTWGDLLGEVVPNSTALAHESCMAQRGKIFGLNTGRILEFGGKDNDISISK